MQSHQSANVFSHLGQIPWSLDKILNLSMAGQVTAYVM